MKTAPEEVPSAKFSFLMLWSSPWPLDKDVLSEEVEILRFRDLEKNYNKNILKRLEVFWLDIEN